MAEKRTSKGQTRLGERQRRRTERERRNNLSRWLPFGILGLVAVLVVGLGIVGALRSSGAIEDPNAKPQITVDQDKLELGDQKLGSTIRAQFNIKNTGTGTLKMKVPSAPSAVEGCWPSKIVVGSTTLQPGESTTLYTDMMMHGDMGGKHLFEIDVQTNDKDHPTEKLQIASNWIP